jgi:hypothetical protein
MSRSLLATLVVTILAGCTGSSGVQPALTSAQSILPSGPAVEARSALIADGVVDSRNGCAKRVRSHLRRHGGRLNVRGCKDWISTIDYPALEFLCSRHFPGCSLYSEVSTRNIFHAPSPPSGTALFYMRISQDFGQPMFKSSGVTDTITSPQLTSSHTYTLNVYYYCDNGCTIWTANIGSPEGNTDSITFPSPLNGAWMINRIPQVWQFVQN